MNKWSSLCYFWRCLQDDKDKKIQELTTELRNEKRLCIMYQEQLIAFMKDVEDHNTQITKKVQAVLINIKEVENQEPKSLQLG